MTTAEKLARNRLANAKWRASHKEQERIRQKAYRDSHRALISQTTKAWAAANVENRKAYGAAYRAARRAETRKKAKDKRVANQAAMCALDKAYRLAHPEQVRTTKATYRAVHREQERAYRKAYYEQHKTERAAKHLAWARANPGTVNAIVMRRHAAKRNATPAWANHDMIRAIYAVAARLTRNTGVKHEVDHIYPLQSDWVCGLHVETNLQILTKPENIRKHNKPPTGVRPHVVAPETILLQ